MSDLIYHNGELWHAEDLSDDVLMHYGVKGMKWGKRTMRKQQLKPLKKQYVRDLDNQNYDYMRKVVGLRLAKSDGKIDKSTYRAKTRGADDAFNKSAAERQAKYRADVEAVKAAIKANRQQYKQNYKQARAANPIKTNPLLINPLYTSARANGANRKQALANVYTKQYTKRAIYDR